MPLDEVLAHFDSYDTDVSGGIDFGEFVKKTGLNKEAFASLDKNGDLIVKLEEFDVDAAREKKERAKI
jgi:Ca2+-binding EF-hand superfamily protein